MLCCTSVIPAEEWVNGTHMCILGKAAEDTVSECRCEAAVSPVRALR